MYRKCEKYPVMDGEPQLGTQEECEIIEAEGEGLELVLQMLIDNGEIPVVFYAQDDYSGEEIELKTSDYLNSTFVKWFENKKDFDEYREFTMRELIRAVNGGLSSDDLRESVKSSIVELGESIEGYVEHNDLYLSDSLSQEIIDKGLEAFWDKTIFWNENHDDSYYDDHKAFVIDDLALTEDEQEEYEDEIMDAIREYVYVSFDYSAALDYTGVKLNVAYSSGWDYIYGWESIVYEDSKIVEIPEEYDQVLKLFGYKLEDYVAWYNNDDRPKHRFFKSFEAEIDNSGQGFTEIVFLLKMPLSDVLKLKQANTLTIGTGVDCGMFDRWNGGGSILELHPEKDTVLDLKEVTPGYKEEQPGTPFVTWRVDGQAGSYDVNEVYGLCGDSWSSDYKIEGGEDDEEDEEDNI